MPSQIEITTKPHLIDAEGEALRRKVLDYFGIEIEAVRTVHILTLDAALSTDQLERIRKGIFTNPVTQLSDVVPLALPADWIVWIGFRPGVRDSAGATAVEAVEDFLGIRFGPDQAIYSSKRYCLSGKGLEEQDIRLIVSQMLANDIIQQYKIFPAAEWDPRRGVGPVIAKVRLDHLADISVMPIDSEAVLEEVNRQRNLGLNSNDIPVVRAYFLDPQVRAARAAVGLGGPTDVELEYISQARSDHCNHNTFRGLFHYSDPVTGERETIDNLFKTCIQTPTLELQRQKPWVVSVLWDNAGVGRLDENHYYTITGETHNSPSNLEAYGGANTGIVGIYRDLMGTGKGSRLIMGSYGFCVGPRDYAGDLEPSLHPRRLLDGLIEGVRDGGNKSAVPTPFGQVHFDHGYMGKCLVFVTALGLMPAQVNGEPSEQKTIFPGDKIVMCGGRVGKDGLHGVTASSETFSESTPAGHVQIGDPFTQKKMHDFLLEARDAGMIRYITDNGGGGLSSSVGETAYHSNGCRVELEKVPLKYAGLDQWEIWVSESQERMTVAVAPENVAAFLRLSARHAVESTVIGEYTDSGRLHITYNGQTSAYVDLSLMEASFPQWVFEAEWLPPERRGLFEPVLDAPQSHNELLLAMLERPNICAKAWIARQCDHEAQGTSVIKPLVGVQRDVFSDAAVLRPVLASRRGLALSQGLLPFYSRIDAYHMTSCTIDEAVRRLIAVGGDPEHIGGVDNFCWPTIQYDQRTNPDGRFKAAQLVRSCRALREMCLAYGIPLLSGKDSMYVDGHLPGRYGERHKVSALETLQFAAVSVIDDIENCITLAPHVAGDLVYLLGSTRDELGGSEYYDLFGYVGCNVPQVDAERNLALYRALAQAIAGGLVASAHGVYRGGLAVHLAMKAMAGELGLEINLADAPQAGKLRYDQLLYSESSGRLLVTIDPADRERFETLLTGQPAACIGRVTAQPILTIYDRERQKLIDLPVASLKQAWQRPFGKLI